MKNAKHARGRRHGSPQGHGSKLKLEPYEIMTLLGATEPRLSDRLKNALDEELRTPELAALPHLHAWKIAARRLADHRPEAFDPANRDDRVMQRLAPLMIRKDGSVVPPPELMTLIEPDNMTIRAQDQGDHLLLDVAAFGKGEILKASFLASKNRAES